MRLKSLFSVWVLSLLSLVAPANACTIFALTDTNRVLFCNSEDWTNPKTRIWFIPATTNSYGCGLVGFDNGWAQGGVNTKGLAYDWVAGFQGKWEKTSGMKLARGNPSQRMLETCATVDDAIAFFKAYWEPGFGYARMFVADSSGASAILSAEDGKLVAHRSNSSQGFGYGGNALKTMLTSNSPVTVNQGFNILRACKQRGTYATKYQNVFDLKSGDIFLLPTADENEEQVALNLNSELRKGGHYYDLPSIRKQLERPPMNLRNNMRRFAMDDYKPIPDREPQMTAHIRAMFLDLMNGTAKQSDYSPELWAELGSQQKETAKELKAFGDLISLTLVDRRAEDEKQVYRYRLDFSKTVLLQQFGFDKEKRLSETATEDVIPKEAAPAA